MTGVSSHGLHGPLLKAGSFPLGPFTGSLPVRAIFLPECTCPLLLGKLQNSVWLRLSRVAQALLTGDTHSFLLPCCCQCGHCLVRGRCGRSFSLKTSPCSGPRGLGGVPARSPLGEPDFLFCEEGLADCAPRAPDHPCAQCGAFSVCPEPGSLDGAFALLRDAPDTETHTGPSCASSLSSRSKRWVTRAPCEVPGPLRRVIRSLPTILPHPLRLQTWP